MLPENVKSRSTLASDLLFLGTLLIIFYTFWLGGYPLFTPDEGRYSEVAREMIASNDYITPRVNGVAFLDKPVLYYWLQAAAIKLFGLKEWALRFFPAIFGIFGCLITYVCGRQLFDRRTGLLAAIILATSPLYFCGAHYANLDLEVAVLISTSLLLFLTGVQNDGKYRSVILLSAYISAALAFLTKGLIGIVFPIMITGAWIFLLSNWKLLLRIHLLTGLMLIALIVFPWYYLVQQANPEFLHYFFVTQQVTRFLSTTTFNNPTPVWFYLPIVLIGFFPWTSFLLQALTVNIRQAWQARFNHQAELFLLLWTGIVFIFFSVPHSKMITYILPIFPPLALLVARYLSCTWQETTNRGIKLGKALAAIMSADMIVFFVCAKQNHWMNLPADFMPYLNIMMFILLTQCLLILFLWRSKAARLFLLLVISNIFFLSMLTVGAKYLNQHSAKPLVTVLKTLRQGDEEVIHYFKFYQDIPLYLEKRVTIVADWSSPKIPYNDNWLRELWYGMPFQNTSDWLITEEIFWQKWYGNKRVFVFVNQNYYDHFKKQASSYYFIAENDGILLLSNKPTIS